MEVLILDVRDHGKRADEGYIEQAYHIPVNNMWERIDELQDWYDKKILVHCGVGCGAAATAVWILKDQGYTDVENTHRMPETIQRYKELTGREVL